MKPNNRHLTSLLLILLLFATSSTSLVSAQKRQSFDIGNLSKRLGIDISEHSTNIPLYREAAKWLGTRYRRGGMSFSGIDCSGLTGSIYRAVYDKILNRRSIDIANNLLADVKKEDLQPGDMVFFATGGRKKGINHVGIYLKDNKFVHASCSRGVIVSSLDEAYYQRAWKKGGRVNLGQYPIRFMPIPDLTSETLLLSETSLLEKDIATSNLLN
ncbi:C40 family peptidase [Dysgonomonas sp. 520]|uniref:C40 family peptidase n=1 Tax=Dysgonomonas sp. 520 TaxID=2302931 RepID=UPI0013D54C57|nr:C40 family peptidase [Dysgonomonas sp. 520]NDW10108.1 NlpC/P60 family protein [Dysgonomonas sp. 520]